MMPAEARASAGCFLRKRMHHREHGEHREENEERRKRKDGACAEQRDSSTARPDAPQTGAKERSGRSARNDTAWLQAEVNALWETGAAIRGL